MGAKEGEWNENKGRRMKWGDGKEREKKWKERKKNTVGGMEGE